MKSYLLAAALLLGAPLLGSTIAPSKADAGYYCRSICRPVTQCHTTYRVFTRRYCTPTYRTYNTYRCTYFYGRRVCRYYRERRTVRNCTIRSYRQPSRRCYTRRICSRKCSYW